MIRNKTDYSFLAFLTIAYLVAVFRFQSRQDYLLIATGIFAMSYFVWGISHHLRTHSFHARIVLEYFLVALLGVIIISTLLI